MLVDSGDYRIAIPVFARKLWLSTSRQLRKKLREKESLETSDASCETGVSECGTNRATAGLASHAHSNDSLSAGPGNLRVRAMRANSLSVRQTFNVQSACAE